MVKKKHIHCFATASLSRFPVSTVLLLIALGIAPLAKVEAQTVFPALQAFPDHLKIRAELLSAVVTAAPERALAFKTVFRDSAAGRVQVSVESDGPSFYVLFLAERDGEYPYTSRGNVIIKRDTKTGYIARVVWYLDDNGQSWISLTPRNEKTIVDYVVAGSAVREGFAVSRLIYQFITNPFTYLYDATKSGLEWSLLFGKPGPQPAMTLMNQLNQFLSGQRQAVAGALVKAASDFTSVGRYLSAAGAGTAEPVEETAPRYGRIANPVDPRSPAIAPVPKYDDNLGLPIEAVGGLLAAGETTGSVYIALVEGVGDFLPVDLVLIPYYDADGLASVFSVDATNSAQVEMGGFVKSRAGAYLRLFRLPLPVVSP
jgi:hypothetical protein